MQQTALSSIKEESMLEKFVNKITKKTDFDIIKANVEGFDMPSAYENKETGNKYIPDVVALKNNKRTYFEMAIKSEMKNKTINKWKLLSTLAEMRRGELVLVAPQGNYAFTQRLCERHDIQAKIIKI